MAIVKRSTKGSPLSHSELDNNFTELDQRIQTLEQDDGGTELSGSDLLGTDNKVKAVHLPDVNFSDDDFSGTGASGSPVKLNRAIIKAYLQSLPGFGTGKVLTSAFQWAVVETTGGDPGGGDPGGGDDGDDENPTDPGGGDTGDLIPSTGGDETEGPVAFREPFYNPGSGQTGAFSSLGWKCYAGDAGVENTSENTLYLSNEAGGSGATKPINAGYLNDAARSFLVSTGNRNKEFVCKEGLDIPMAGKTITEITWYQSHSSTSITTRPAVQIGGSWYFINDKLNQNVTAQNDGVMAAGNGEFKSFLFDGSGSTFRTLNLTPGSSLNVDWSGSELPLPNGNITGIGFYCGMSSAPTGTLRFDCIEIKIAYV